MCSTTLYSPKGGSLTGCCVVRFLSFDDYNPYLPPRLVVSHIYHLTFQLLLVFSAFSKTYPQSPLILRISLSVHTPQIFCPREIMQAPVRVDNSIMLSHSHSLSAKTRASANVSLPSASVLRTRFARNGEMGLEIRKWDKLFTNQFRLTFNSLSVTGSQYVRWHNSTSINHVRACCNNKVGFDSLRLILTNRSCCTKNSSGSSTRFRPSFSLLHKP